MKSVSRWRAAHVIATEMTPEIAHRTWSLMDLGSEPTCHAFLLSEGGARVGDAAGSGDISLSGPALVWFPRSGDQRYRLLAGGRGAHFSARAAFIERTIGASALGLHLRPILRAPLVLHADRIADRDRELGVAFLALAREAREQEAGAAEMMAASLTLILIHLGRMSAEPSVSAPGRTLHVPTAQRFSQLLELHYQEGLGIDAYADLLGVTRAHLHDTCLKAFGRTPLALIHARLIDEAGRRLSHTALPVEQIAYSLGFRDPAYFNRFFKRLTGSTPGNFRRQAAHSRSAADTSFAAWP